MRSRKAQATLYIIFIVSALFILLVAAVLAPLGVLMNTELYLAGQSIMENAQGSVGAINNATIRNQVNSTMTTALAATQNNIDINAAFFQYGWVLILVLASLIAFIFTRRLVEYGQGGFI